MIHWIHKHEIPKISELLDDFYSRNVGVRAGYTADASEEEKIEKASLDFLTFNLGKVWQDITDDSNLNAEIVNLFAQDFIRQFWNNQIAYRDTMSFYVKLRGFMDQWLPIWGQFYKEAVLDKAAFITSLGSVSTTGSGLVHVDGLSSGASSSDGKTSTTTTANTQSTNTGTTDSTTNGSSTNSTDGSNSTKTNGNTNQLTTGDDTTTKQDKTITDAQNMQLDADTPQDGINATNFYNGGGDGKSAAPLSAYNFNYASSASGQHNLTNVATNDTDTITHNTNVKTSQDDLVYGKDHQDSTITNHSHTDGTNTSKGSSETESTTTGTNSLSGSTSTKQNSDTSSKSAGTTNTRMRGLPLTQIAREFDEMANGAYLRIFAEAKKAGLFLGVY
jgi:hypothetical protein